MYFRALNILLAAAAFSVSAVLLSCAGQSSSMHREEISGTLPDGTQFHQVVESRGDAKGPANQNYPSLTSASRKGSDGNSGAQKPGSQAVASLWWAPIAGVVCIAVGVFFTYAAFQIPGLAFLPVGWSVAIAIGGVVLLFLQSIVETVGPVLAWTILGVGIVVLIGVFGAGDNIRRMIRERLNRLAFGVGGQS